MPTLKYVGGLHAMEVNHQRVPRDGTVDVADEEAVSMLAGGEWKAVEVPPPASAKKADKSAEDEKKD